MERSEVSGKRFSVIGGARSGSAVARLLHQHGAQVFVSEKTDKTTMQQTADELDNLGIRYEFGGHSASALDADVVVVSPGVPLDSPLVTAARSRNVRIVGELETASWFCRGSILAVTGTNGKTTTTALLGRMFHDARRRSVVAGNIGTAFSEVIDTVEENTVVILEVSSFQLDTIETFRPHISIILNITPDHLDRYEHSLQKYIDAKARVFENQQDGDTIIYNWDDENVRKLVNDRAPRNVRQLPFSVSEALEEGAYVRNAKVMILLKGMESSIIATDHLALRGQHNLMNAMAATLAAAIMGVPAKSLHVSLSEFRGVEHRLEFVREVNGITYVNDSKATNVDSVWYALQSFTGPIVLLLGGRDKGNDYKSLIELVKKHVKAIVAIGESAGKVKAAFEGLVPLTTAGNMETAVHAAIRYAEAGDTVLLSPACASFDWFDNYEQRGRVFKEIVSNL